MFTFVVVIVSITGSQRRRSPLDKSRRRKTEYTLATALRTRVPYTLVHPSAQSAAAIRLQEYSFLYTASVSSYLFPILNLVSLQDSMVFYFSVTRLAFDIECADATG